MSRGVSGRARRRASLALLSLACLARLPSARGAVHAYGHDAFERVGDAFFFYAGRSTQISSIKSFSPLVVPKFSLVQQQYFFMVSSV